MADYSIRILPLLTRGRKRVILGLMMFDQEDVAAQIVALRARVAAQGLRSAPKRAASTASVLAFWIGGICYGIPRAFVLGVDRDPLVTRLPLVPSFVVGIYNFRGVLQPLIDLIMAGSSASDPHSRKYVVNIASAPHSVGLLVDQVEGVVAGPGEAAPQPDDEAEGLPGQAIEETSIILLDVPALLNDVAARIAAATDKMGVAGPRTIATKEGESHVAHSTN